MKSTRRPRREAGFTLPELLIALLIFAMISGAGVFALQLGVEGRSQLAAADDRLREIELFRTLLKSDLRLLTKRPVRDEYGDTNGAIFVGGRGFATRPPVAGETPLMGFVRSGWDNPAGVAPRSSLQYVEYLLIDEALVRRTRPYLDAARNQPYADRVVIASAENLQVQFYERETSTGLQWADIWPLPNLQGRPPQAVRVAFDTRRLGTVEQLFWIGQVQ